MPNPVAKHPFSTAPRGGPPQFQEVCSHNNPSKQGRRAPPGAPSPPSEFGGCGPAAKGGSRVDPAVKESSLVVSIPASGMNSKTLVDVIDARNLFRRRDVDT